MAIQTAYSATLVKGYHGQVADMRLTDILTRECEDATLGFGLAVIKGTGDEQVKVGAAGTFVGLTVRDPSLPPSAANQDKYLDGDAVAVMQKGAMWITAPATITAGEAVYRTAAGALTNVSTSNTLIAGAIFETGGASGALVRVALK